MRRCAPVLELCGGDGVHFQGPPAGNAVAGDAVGGRLVLRRQHR